MIRDRAGLDEMRKIYCEEDRTASCICVSNPEMMRNEERKRRFFDENTILAFEHTDLPQKRYTISTIRT